MNEKNRRQLLALGAIVVLLPLLMIGLWVRKQITSRADLTTLPITITPASLSKNVGDTFPLAVSLLSVNPLSGVTITVQFDPHMLSLQSVSGNTSSFSEDLSSNTQSAQGLGTLSTVALKPYDQLPKGPLQVGTITFKAIGPGTTSITLNSSEIVGPGATAGTLNQFAAALSSPVSIAIGTNGTTPSPTPSQDSPIISFKLKLTGVDRQGPSLPFKLHIVDPTTGTYWDFVQTLTSNVNGMYSFDGFLILSGVPSGKPYNIFVKGPKHLQRRMGSRIIIPTKNEPQNVFDWTDKPLLPGDVPNPSQNYSQDGIANALDNSLIIERIYHDGQNATLVADLNYDGVVNLFDYSLFLATLSSKNDDDE